MGTIGDTVQKILLKILLALLWGYRYLISPMMGNCCRFYPSCSAYAETALKNYGIVRGIGFSFCRLMRCHPFTAGGYDPLPPSTSPNHKKN